MKNYKGYFTVDRRIFELKMMSLEKDLFLELSSREYTQRLKEELPVGQFYVNQLEWSKKYNVSQMTISRAFKKLVENGLISIIKKSRSKGVPSIYRLENVYHQHLINVNHAKGVEHLENTDNGNIILFPNVKQRDKVNEE